MARAAPTVMPGGLRDRWLVWRDRLIASRRFRDWAAAFPLTRHIARRRTAALFDLCAGFVYSQVLFACVRLGLFDLLAEGPATPVMLAPRLGLPEDGARRLLRAAEALGLVEARGDGRFGLGQLGAAMIDNPGIAAMVEHHQLLYADLAEPLPLLAGEAGETRLQRFWAYARNDRPAEMADAAAAPYSALMAASQDLVAAEILASYRFAEHRRLLDIGGGDGSFLAAVARAAPDLELMLFDLPAVAARAEARFAADGLAGRVQCFGGDFFADPLPQGADIIALVRVVHDHDDGAAARLLGRAHASLTPGGTLLLAEPLAGTSGAEASGDAYFGFYLMAMGSGRPRRFGELETLLREAGFDRIRLLPARNPLIARVITAVAT